MEPLSALETIKEFFALLGWLEKNYSGAKQAYSQLSVLHLTTQVIEDKFARLRDQWSSPDRSSAPLSDREKLLLSLAQRVIGSIHELKETVENNKKRNFIIAQLRKFICGAQWKEQSNDVTLNVILLVGSLNLYNENKDIKEIREFIKMVEPTGMRSDILTCIQDGKAKNLADVLNHTIYTIHSAVKNRNVNEIIKTCKANPECINRKNNRSQTPLLIALNKAPNDIETNDETDLIIVKHLLCSGADPNMADNDGFCPLHRAIRCQKPASIIKLLIDYGADVMKLNVHMEAPVHFACKSSGNLSYVELLAQKNIQCLYLEDEELQTPLYQAVKNRKLEIIEFLLNRGAYDQLSQQSKEDLDFMIKFMTMTTEEECDYVMKLRNLFEINNTQSI